MADTTEDQLSHRIVQLSVFLPNRLGALLSLTRVFDNHNILVRGLNIVDAADHAVARLVLDQPTLASGVLRNEGYSLVETDLLGVALPPGRGVRQLLKSILMAELNIHYVYSLINADNGASILAIHLEDPTSGARVLSERGFRLLSQADLA